MSALRAAVAGKVGQERFDLWFGTSVRLEVVAGRLIVSVPNPFFQQWLRSNFSRQIELACLETLGEQPALEFRVDATLPTPRAAAAPSPNGNAGSATAEPGDSPEAPPTASQGPDASARSNGMKRRRFADLESFAMGPSNQLARTAADSVARRPGELSPLLVYGPTGVGKTHLLEGLWTEVRKRHRQLTTVYLSAEQFTTGFLQALRGSGLPGFRRKYRGVDLLILDDLQFFRGKRCTQIELLYTVDTLLRDGRQLVFAADRPPTELADLGPELTTRLASGMVCRIEPPDYQTRLEIIARMARRLGMSVSDDVRQYVASRLTCHARELSGALCRLRATSQAFAKPITRALAEESLAEMVRASRPAVRLPDIEKAMCEAFGLEPNSLQSAGKAKSVSHPRMLAMWLARKYTRSALSEISQYFGRRSHTTVLSAQKRVDRWLADGKSLEMVDRTWTVDDAIQQVERRLRVG
ncbi:MAG: chromosomal replication initiator protein DnaA [Planctomycetota bacterium]